jgi:hypothetical protein
MYPSYEWIVFTLWEIFKTLLVVKRRNLFGGSCQWTSSSFSSPYRDILTGFLVFFKIHFSSVVRFNLVSICWPNRHCEIVIFDTVTLLTNTSRWLHCALHYRVRCICCTIEYDVPSALSSTIYLLHYRVRCTCWTIEYDVPAWLSSTMCLLHYRVRCTCCTIEYGVSDAVSSPFSCSDFYDFSFTVPISKRTHPVAKMFSFSLQFLVSLNYNINHSVPQVH